MRKRFEQQYQLGVKPITGIEIMVKSRDSLTALAKALLELYQMPRFNEQLYQILEDKIINGKNITGRKGLNLWQIFVLAEFRLALNVSYDRLHHMANYDSLLRQLLGIETESGFERIEIGYQRIVDNVHLLDDKTLREINEVIVGFGHNVFKKKDTEALRLKTDSYVVETNVHFPTDYGLLWDSARKGLSIVEKSKKKYPSLKNWRKSKDWYRTLKKLCRSLGRASSAGGKDKEKRVMQCTRDYLKKASALQDKLLEYSQEFPVNDTIDIANIISLEMFISLMEKHIDLVERRILKKEKIPHEEKLFSIFEQYTEWITKGKLRPNVELGKKLAITTDQYNMIVDYHIMENQQDNAIVLPVADRMIAKYKVYSWSFDKGFWDKDNKALLQLEVEQVVMPKKGKRNKEEEEQERAPVFKKLRNKHSAVESNINELENRGLNRCPDKGFDGFKRYTSIGVVAYNLHRIGKELLKKELAQQKTKFQEAKKAA